MNEPESALKNLRAPAPDPQARLRAKRAAMAEFARVQAAGEAAENSAPDNFLKALFAKARLSRDTSHGSTAMKWFTNRGLMAGAAGVGVLAIGLATVLPNLDRHAADLAQPEIDTAMPAVADEQGSGTSPDEPVDSAQADTSVTLPAEMPRQEAGRELPASTPPPATGASPPPKTLQQDAAARFARSEAERNMVGQIRAEQILAEQLRAEQAAQLQDEFKATQAIEHQAPPAIVLSAEAAPRLDEQLEQVIVTGQRANRRVAQESRHSPSPVMSVQSMAKASNAADLVSRPAPPPPPYAPGMELEDRDAFEHFDSNPLQRVSEHPVSTFSADVDTASYSFVRAQLDRGVLPQKDAVRVEEMINYFDYAWPAARSRKTPFEPTVVVSDSPWGKGKKLVHIGIKGYEVDRESAPDANLVLLLDVSGSMNAPDKLPLVIRSMEMLLDSLKPSDTVGIVVYAGQAGTVLEPTPVRNKERIVEALRSLTPGGSTAGAAGIERAYDLAEANFRKGGVNRILLATDGDFNVGVSGTEALKGLVERKREKGVYLSVLGFGQGNYRDELAQALAQNGNGVAAYIDTEKEARKVLVQQASGSLFTIARDVKLQVEFNPATVSEYRLVGYETRALRREDFNNDAVDAGDVGAGHTVTAIYELTPVGVASSVDEPRYEGNATPRKSEDNPARGSREEYGFLKIRYKLPGEDQSRLMSEPIPLRSASQSAAVSRDVSFSTAVAGFAQLLRGGAHTGSLSYSDVLRQAQASKGEDPQGYRAEFIELVKRARRASGD